MILIADDNTDVRRMIRSLIEEGKKAALEAQKVPSEGTPVVTDGASASAEPTES